MVSNDSDLALPVELVVTQFHKKVMVLIPPRTRYQEEERKVQPAKKLMQASSYCQVIQPAELEQSQFPIKMTDHKGQFSCPREWLHE